VRAESQAQCIDLNGVNSMLMQQPPYLRSIWVMTLSPFPPKVSKSNVQVRAVRTFICQNYENVKLHKFLYRTLMGFICK